jgi:hypothetical protein
MPRRDDGGKVKSTGIQSCDKSQHSNGLSSQQTSFAPDTNPVRSFRSPAARRRAPYCDWLLFAGLGTLLN